MGKMLNADSYKLYLICGLVTISIKFGLSIDWGAASGVGILVTVLIQWLHNRAVAKSWQNAIDDYYTLLKECGYKTEKIFTDNATNTKNITLNKTLNVNKGAGYRDEVCISVHLNFANAHIIYHKANANPADKLVSLIYPLETNLTASFIHEIERHALCERSHTPICI